MRVALIQQEAHLDKAANVERGLSAVDRAAAEGAQVVAFAELAFERFHPQRPAESDPRALAEPVPGPITEAFAERARRHGMVIVLNLFERAGNRCFDCSPVIDADGTLLGRTRMVHITDYEGFHEQGYYAPGDTGAPVYATRAGRIGVAICYDRHYPEYMRAMALGGAELVVVPQAGAVDEWPAGLYEAEMAVAAFQNGYYVALCNRVGREERLDFAGESFVCGPDGRTIARAGAGSEETLIVDLDREAPSASHARRLFLRDRRPDLYGAWLGAGSEPAPPRRPPAPLEWTLAAARVRPWRRTDPAALQRHADDPEVASNLRDIFPHPYTRLDADQWVAKCVNSPHGLCWAIEIDDEAAGAIGLHPDGDVMRGCAEIGYWIGRSHWGRGIASEAVREVTAAGFGVFGFRRIHAEVFDWNPASARVLEKNGYECEGRLRRALIKGSRVGDRLLYARTAP